jgi:hypothetical protein
MSSFVRRLGIAAVFCVAATACAEAGSDASKAAKDFYAAYSTLRKGGVPDAAGLAKLEPLVSPALSALLAETAKVEEAHTKATNNEEPPYIEGDLFSSSFEGATSAVVGACNGDAKATQCAVALTYDDGKQKPVKWTDTAIVISTDKGWRVDDIVYGGNWAFGNKGKLSDTLKAVIAEGSAAPK